MDTSDFWEHLVDLVQEGSVVPVVGRKLLSLERDGTTIELYGLLARELFARLKDLHPGVPPPPLDTEDALGTVAAWHLAAGGDRKLLYRRIKEIVDESEPVPMPDPLIKLAQISDFKLFVTTTFDPLLERALNQVRFKGEAGTRVLSYVHDTPKDIGANWDRDPSPLVFHLFGRLAAAPRYAVTQEDTVEWVHTLQSDERPRNLFSELDGRHLLVLGGHFGGWLARFFVRTPKSQRLRIDRDTTDYLVDDAIRSDPSVMFFMRHLARGIEVFEDSGPIEFVDQLHKEWESRSDKPTDAGAPAPGDWSGSIQPGAVFLSYAREDEEVTRAIKISLEERVAHVFFDRDDLMVGDRWERKLRRAIKESSAFIAVLSKNALSKPRRGLFDEWYEAGEVRRTTRADLEFILPVIVDDSDESDFSEFFGDVHIERLPGGMTSPDFVERVVALYRTHQTSRA